MHRLLSTATTTNTTTASSIFPTLTPTALSHLSSLSSLILSGHRPSLSRAITLLESTRPEHRAQANHLLLLLAAAHERANRRSLRIGISGPPGVGKSTFIEKLGQWIVDGAVLPHQQSDHPFSSASASASAAAAAAHSVDPPAAQPSSPAPHTATGDRLAILTIDPSSHLTGGSILGDRTRMPLLSAHPAVYIRPSPSKLSLGGVHPATYDALTVSEYAGYNVQLVETVGVGQSEVGVRQLVDCMLLLVAPAGGDELQGMKKGIIELADIVVVNKADGALLPSARHTFSDYRHAVQLMARGPDAWRPEVMMCSAVEDDGASVGRVWQMVQRFDAWLGEDRKRAQRAVQERRVMMEHVPQVMWGLLMASDRGRHVVRSVEDRVSRGELNVRLGAQTIVEQLMLGWMHDHHDHTPPP